jgi:uncharacterized protein (TIGR02611 family)
MQSVSQNRFVSKIRQALHWDDLSPGVRKIIAGVVGGLVLLAGLAMVFLPGPAFVVIPLGLAILATEFAWARHYLRKARAWFDRQRAKHSNRKKARHTAAHAR